jgi:anti-sigma factor RsiW
MTQSSNLQLNDADLELLSAYIDSQLANDERAALEERLRREPALRAALDELRATVVLLHELEPLKPPRSFTLDPQIYQPRRTSLFARLNLGSALTAVVLAFLCLAVFTIRGLLPTSNTASVSAPMAAATAAGGAQAFIAEATAAPASGGGALATAAPPPPEVALGSAATSAPAFDAGGYPAQGTAEPPAAMAPAAAAAATAAPVGGASKPTANGAEAPTAAALAQQPSIPLATPGEAYPPIATSGSTSSNTTYIPPQPVSSPAAGQAPPSAGQNPITLLIGVPLMLLLIIGLLWLRRRR